MAVIFQRLFRNLLPASRPSSLMPRFRIVLALLALAALAGCVTSSAHAGRGTQTPHPDTAPVEQASDAEEAKAQPASPESSQKTPAASATKSHRKSPEPEPAVAAPSAPSELSSAQAEFFCGASGALERRAPMERPASVVSFESSMTRPEKLAGPQPFYTKEALDQNIQGQVLARCILTREGTVRSCRILKPLPIMDEEVLLSLCASRYSPALDGGQPVDVEYTFNVRLTPP